MKKACLLFVLATFVLLSGCATSGQFKKSERVKLILHSGHKIKCYVTHISKNTVFFQATSASDAYNYGDMMNFGQIRAIQLADNTEMSVAEYRDYRNNVYKALKESEKIQSTNVLMDPLYEKLKHKEIDKMSDKEFRYFLLMKEQENVLRLRQAEKDEEKKQVEELEKLNQKLATIQAQNVVPMPPPPNWKAAPETGSHPMPVLQAPLPSNEMPQRQPIEVVQETDEIQRLVHQTQMTGQILRRADELRKQGRILSAQQQRFLKALSESKQWQHYREQLIVTGKIAREALEQVYLTQPALLQDKLGLTFDANEMLNFPDMLAQMSEKIGTQLNMNEYRTLVQIFGQDGAKAIKTLIENFSDWVFIQNGSLSFNR